MKRVVTQFTCMLSAPPTVCWAQGLEFSLFTLVPRRQDMYPDSQSLWGKVLGKPNYGREKSLYGLQFIRQIQGRTYWNGAHLPQRLPSLELHLADVRAFVPDDLRVKAVHCWLYCCTSSSP